VYQSGPLVPRENTRDVLRQVGPHWDMDLCLRPALHQCTARRRPGGGNQGVSHAGRGADGNFRRGHKRARLAGWAVGACRCRWRVRIRSTNGGRGVATKPALTHLGERGRQAIKILSLPVEVCSELHASPTCRPGVRSTMSAV